MILQNKEEKGIIWNNIEDIYFDIMSLFDLKHFRLTVAKLNQEEFARKIGVATGSIGKIEAGHQKISDKMLQRIANSFGVDLEKYKSYSVEEPTIAGESPLVYENRWKAKYYELLEENKALQQKLIGCLEEKDKLKEGYKSSPGKVNKPISK